MTTYHATVEREDRHYGILVFSDKTWKDDLDPEDVPSVKPLHLVLSGLKENSEEGLAEACLVALYDHHQVSDDFKDGDEIEIASVGTFLVRSFEVYPANKEMMTRGEKPYGVRYEGMDGTTTRSFDDLNAAAKYVKDRWEGVEYMDSDTAFHNDYGRFYLRGFKLSDIGKVTGEGFLQTYEFNKEEN